MNKTMKRYILLLSAALTFILGASAQPAAVKKAAQGVLSLNTFRADGSLISTSYGMFVSDSGEAVAQWTPFEGAAKAVAVDAQGRRYEVEELIGADDLYNVCKFRVSGKTPFTPVAQAPKSESQLWVACYSVKGARLLNASTKKFETFTRNPTGTAEKSFPFYILDFQAPSDVSYCPVIDSRGEAVALLQSSSPDGTANAVSILYPSEMTFQKIGGSMLTLSKSSIPSALPSDYSDAQLALMLNQQQRTPEAMMATANLFIKRFPNKPDGYQARARQYIATKDFRKAADDLEHAISVAENKAEAHCAYSVAILQKLMYLPADSFPEWTAEKAIAEARAAYSISPSPAYLLQSAKAMFVAGDYSEAYDAYMKLQDTNLAGPETMYGAVQCQQALQAPADTVLALMDSTIALCPHPLTYQSAPYVLQKGIICQDLGLYRKATASYNEYERLMVGTQLSAAFYHNRFICNREARLYQQALDDIQKATELEPRNALYHCAKGALEIRVNLAEQAITSANNALIADPRNADAYAILGVAQCMTGRKHEGILNIEQAKSYGYADADKLLKKYK